MPHPTRLTVKARLLAGEKAAPVVASLREVVDVRDRRSIWKGIVWSTRLPLDFPLEGAMTLALPDGRTEAIQLTSSEVSAPTRRGQWRRFRGSFISERNVRSRG